MSRVLVARLDNAGDVLLTGPAVRAVAAASSEVVMACGPAGAPAAELLAGVDRVITLLAPWVPTDPPPFDRDVLEAFEEEVRQVGPDRAIIFTSHHQSSLPLALVLRRAGVPWVGAISDDYPGSLLDLRHRCEPHLHEVERNLSLAAAAGYALPAGDDRRLRLREAPRPRRVADVVVHPGASVPARTWPPARWAELVRALTGQGVRVAVTGGPSERALTAAVCAEAGPKAIDLGGATDFAGLAEVIAGASVVVTGNTGPAHLAAAVGTPVVSIYPPTVPVERWRPWRVAHVTLGDQGVPCAGCRQRVCPVAGQPCIGSIELVDAVDAVARLLPRRAPVTVVAS